LALLKAIGVAQMENELLKRYRLVKERSGPSQIKESRFEKDNVREALHEMVNEMGKEHVREILHDVLIELYSKTKENRKE